MDIASKRVYDLPSANDGRRILIDRLWPRGLSKETLKLDAWHKDAAPSTELRKWFGHDPQRWDAFVERYTGELDAHPQAWEPLLAEAQSGRLTLLYSAHDTEHNNAVALARYLHAKA